MVKTALEDKRIFGGQAPVRAGARTENEARNQTAAKRKSVEHKDVPGSRKFGALTLALTLAFGCVGCAHTPRKASSSASASIRRANSFGKIVLVPIMDSAEVTLQKPYSKPEAALLVMPQSRRAERGL